MKDFNERRLRPGGHILRLLDSRPANAALNWTPVGRRKKEVTTGSSEVTYEERALSGQKLGPKPRIEMNGEDCTGRSRWK